MQRIPRSKKRRLLRDQSVTKQSTRRVVLASTYSLSMPAGQASVAEMAKTRTRRIVRETIPEPLRMVREASRELGPVSVSPPNHARILAREIARGSAGSLDLVSTLIWAH